MPKGQHCLVDRTGQRSGRLLVLERAGSVGHGAAWLCRCDCGTTKIVAGHHLRGNHTKSCGCSRRSGKGSRPRYKYSDPPGQSAKRSILADYRTCAQKRGLAWALTDDEFYAALLGDCSYCGAPPSKMRRVSRNGSFVWNGIDRRDNSIGYVAGNVVPCCFLCNHAKRGRTASEFIEWASKIANHSGTSIGA